MENLWIIAQATETQGQSEVPAEPVGQNQTTTGTVASPDPNTSHTAHRRVLRRRLCSLFSSSAFL